MVYNKILKNSAGGKLMDCRVFRPCMEVAVSLNQLEINITLHYITLRRFLIRKSVYIKKGRTSESVIKWTRFS